MSHDDWQTATQPKINGTWNLPPRPCLTAARLLLDGQLAHHGHRPARPGQLHGSQHLHGGICSVQALARTASLAPQHLRYRRRRLRGRECRRPPQHPRAGLSVLSERELLDCIALNIHAFRARACRHGARVYPGGLATQAMGSAPRRFLWACGPKSPSTNPSNRANWRRDRRMGTYHNEVHDGGAAARERTALSHLPRQACRGRRRAGALQRRHDRVPGRGDGPQESAS